MKGSHANEYLRLGAINLKQDSSTSGIFSTTFEGVEKRRSTVGFTDLDQGSEMMIDLEMILTTFEASFIF